MDKKKPELPLTKTWAGRHAEMWEPAEVEEGVTPPAELLLTEVVPDEPRKPSIQRFKINVPAGFVMPLGEPITQPFSVLVEAGVRWHPEWPEPRVTVNVYRFFHHGDCMLWSGKKALAFKALLPPEVVELASLHGEPMANLGDYGREALEKMGIEPPAERQPLATFIPSNK